MAQGRNCFQVGNVRLAELEAYQVFQAFIQASENCVLAFERILSKEALKNGRIILTVIFPVSVRHGDLIQIGQHGRHQRIGGTQRLLRLCHDC